MVIIPTWEAKICKPANRSRITYDKTIQKSVV